MTDREFEKIALAIKAAYPNSNVLPDKYAMKIWYQALSDLEYEIAENAVLEHISTSVFPPSIAEIREKCSERLSPMITEWGEAWEEVQRAFNCYGSYREEEAVASMSRLTAVTVRRMGFLNLCHSENQIADRAHFQRIYEGLVKEEKRKTQLPCFVRDERNRMIESNSLAALPAPVNEKAAEIQKDDTGVNQEYINQLMKELRMSLNAEGF